MATTKIEKTKNWTFVYSEANSLIANDIFFRGFTDYKKVPGMFNEILYVNRGGTYMCKAPLFEINRIKDEGKIFLYKKFREKFKKSIRNCNDNFENFYQKFLGTDLNKFSNKGLLSVFNNYATQSEKMFAHYQVSGGRCYPIIEGFAKERLNNFFLPDEVNENYAVLLRNTIADSLEREAIELHYFSEKSNITNEELLKHSRKYPLLFINMYNEEKITISLRSRMDEFRNKNQTAIEHEKELLKSKQEQKYKQNKLMRVISKDRKLVDIIEYLREQGRIRFEYKSWKNGAEYRFLNLFQEIAKRMNLPIEEMMLSYLVKDLENFLKKGTVITENERKARKRISVFHQTEKQEKLFASGDKAEKLATELLTEAGELISELRGVIANSGIATGTVHLILPTDWESLQKEMKSFKEGEVLVTTMTEPNLILIMKKAAAIVTNQGGMTSHAAVISRELKYLA